MTYRCTTKDNSKRSRVDEDSDDESEEKSNKNIFRYLMFYIFPTNVGDGRRRVLHNLIKKHGGNYTAVVTNHTTHVLVDENVSTGKVCRLLGWTTFPAHVNVVHIDWLSDCVRAESCLKTTDYLVPNNHKSTFVISSANASTSKNSPDTHYIKPKSQSKSKHSKQPPPEVIEADLSNIDSVEEDESSFDDGIYDGETSCDDDWLHIVPSDTLDLIIPQPSTSFDPLTSSPVATPNPEKSQPGITGMLKLRLYRHKASKRGALYSKYSTVENEPAAESLSPKATHSNSNDSANEENHKIASNSEEQDSLKSISKTEESILKNLESPSVVLKRLITELKVPPDLELPFNKKKKLPEKKEVKTVFVSEASSSLNSSVSISNDIDDEIQIIAGPSSSLNSSVSISNDRDDEILIIAGPSSSLNSSVSISNDRDDEIQIIAGPSSSLNSSVSISNDRDDEIQIIAGPSSSLNSSVSISNDIDDEIQIIAGPSTDAKDEDSNIVLSTSQELKVMNMQTEPTESLIICDSKSLDIPKKDLLEVSNESVSQIVSSSSNMLSEEILNDSKTPSNGDFLLSKSDFNFVIDSKSSLNSDVTKVSSLNEDNCRVSSDQEPSNSKPIGKLAFQNEMYETQDSKISSTTEVVESSNSVSKDLGVSFPDSNISEDLEISSNVFPSSMGCCDLNSLSEPEVLVSHSEIYTNDSVDIDNDSSNVESKKIESTNDITLQTSSIFKNFQNNDSELTQKEKKANLVIEYFCSESLTLEKSSLISSEIKDIADKKSSDPEGSELPFKKPSEKENSKKNQSKEKSNYSEMLNVSGSSKALLNEITVDAISNSESTSASSSKAVSKITEMEISTDQSSKVLSPNSKDLNNSSVDRSINKTVLVSPTNSSELKDSLNFQSEAFVDSIVTESIPDQGEEFKSPLNNSILRSKSLSNSSSNQNHTTKPVSSTQIVFPQNELSSVSVDKLSNSLESSSNELDIDIIKDFSSPSVDFSEKKSNDKLADINFDIEKDSTVLNSAIVNSLAFQDLCDSSDPIQTTSIVTETMTNFITPAVPKLLLKDSIKKTSSSTNSTLCDKSIKFLHEKVLDVSVLVEDISNKLLGGQLISSIKADEMHNSDSMNKTAFHCNANNSISNTKSREAMSLESIDHKSFALNLGQSNHEIAPKSFCTQSNVTASFISNEPTFKVPLQKSPVFKSLSPDSVSHSNVINSINNNPLLSSKRSSNELLSFKSPITTLSLCGDSNLEMSAGSSTQNLDIVSSAQSFDCSSVLSELPEPMDFATAETNLDATLSKSLSSISNSDFKLPSFTYAHESILKDTNELNLTNSHPNNQPLTLTFNSNLSDTVDGKYSLSDLSDLKVPKPFISDSLVSQNELNSCSKDNDFEMLCSGAMDVDSLISDSTNFNKTVLSEKSSDMIADDNFIGISALETFNAELKNFDSTLNIVEDLNNSLNLSSTYQPSETTTAPDPPDNSKPSVSSSPVSSLETMPGPSSASTSSKKKKFSKLFLEAPNNRIIRKLQLLHDSFKRSENKWRMHVYEKAIMAVRKSTRPLTSLEDIQSLDGIAKKIAEKIWEIVQTGQLLTINDVCSQQREGIVKLFSKVWGIGSHAAENLYREGHCTIKDLKTKANLSHAHLIALRYFQDLKRQIPRAEADKIITAVMKRIFSTYPDVQCDICSSLRRNKKSTGHVGLLITLPDGVKNDHKILPEIVAKLHQDGYLIDDLIRHQENGAQTKYAGIFKLKHDGAKHRRLDITVCAKDESACALMTLSGPAYFNKAIRQVAAKQAMVLDEHSLRLRVMNQDGSVTEEKLETPTENAIFEHLGLPFRGPVLRDPDKAKL